MPRLLKKDCIRLVEASIECLALAQLGVSSFHRTDHKVNIVRYAPETGLIGTSIELIMSAVLVQAYDKKVILKDATRYKTATEILHSFRKLLRDRPANISFITNGINDGEAHLDHLVNLTIRFQVVVTSRANALHNGVGLNFDVLSALFQEVSTFIDLISQSSNFRPYMQNIPRLIVLTKEKQILIDEIFGKVRTDTDIESQKINIASLFILLPEVPRNLPEWLDNYTRFNIAPKKNDIVNLIDALEQANPVQLRRVRRGGDLIAVRIDNEDPNAIPIQPQFLRGQFMQFRDQFYADSATANGRLENRQLDLPPPLSVCQCFGIGLEELAVIDESKPHLTAHEAWPIIVAALSVPSNGITLPFWNIVRKTDDLGQLISQLIRASNYGNEPLKNNINEAIYGINCIIKGEPIENHREFYSSTLALYRNLVSKYESFNLSSSKRYDLSESHGLHIELFEKGEISIGELGQIIKQDETLSETCKRYWITKIAGACSELDSMPFLFEVYNDENYQVCRTEIKKTFKSIDLVTFGPRFNVGL